MDSRQQIAFASVGGCFDSQYSRINPDPEIGESSSSSSSCSSSIYWASAPMKEPIFLAIILFRLCDGENSRETSRRTRTTTSQLRNLGLVAPSGRKPQNMLMSSWSDWFSTLVFASRQL